MATTFQPSPADDQIDSAQISDDQIGKAKKRVTAEDIARLAGVPRPYVSVVLNGAKSNVGISAAARERILAASQELGYRVSASARALATGKTRQIAVLAEERGRHQQFGLHGLIEAAVRQDHRVIVLPLHPGDSGERQLDELIRSGVCDGLVLFADQVQDPHLQVLERHDLPCVVLGYSAEIRRAASDNMAYVNFDNYRYAYDSVAWLKAQGHEKIAYIRAPREGHHSHIHFLHQGFQDAMRDLCGQENPPILDSFHRDEELVSYVKSGAVTAVVVRYLHGALQWMFALRAAGFSLPDDFTILAHLEVEEAQMLRMCGRTRYLAAHLHDARRLGFIAGELMLGRLNGQKFEQNITLVPTEPSDWCREALNNLVAIKNLGSDAGKEVFTFPKPSGRETPDPLRPDSAGRASLS